MRKEWLILTIKYIGKDWKDWKNGECYDVEIKRDGMCLIVGDGKVGRGYSNWDSVEKNWEVKREEWE